ncbi:hypothetical protein [uncultured Tenacibaculum sp.]|uniref:hypothetical protein n=1 Tax=uncultured Tenacibaculum sp. TaxID=174713 RepID=UPI00261596F1|nr:hypothetical protein [uncultured Tenacibaculum sp.]
MKKQLLFLNLCLLISFTTFSQALPSCFSWDNVKINNGDSRNFVSNVKPQFFQNPCISHAFINAIETQYNIEFDNSNRNKVNLTVAYLDVMTQLDDKMIKYKNILEGHSLLLPVYKSSEDPFSFRYSEFLPNVGLNNPYNHPDGTYNGYYSEDTRNCINNNKHFIIKNFAFEPDQTWRIDKGNCDSEDIRTKDYLSIGIVEKLNNPSIEELKTSIIENGPVVMKVYDDTVSIFKTYNESVNYHAYTIIGWEDVNESTTKWRLTDSWKGSTSVDYSNSINNNTFLNLANNSDKIEIYKIDDVKFRGSKNGANEFTVDKNIQCVPQPSTLSGIDVNIDHVYVGGYLYHKFWVTSNQNIDNWIWGIDYPNGSLKRSQVNNNTYSSVLLSPTSSGVVTVYVNAYKNGVKVATKERRIYLSNGTNTGGGNGNDAGW